MITWKPALCTQCRTRPAVLGVEEPFACWECGTPCGDECCGVDFCEEATLLQALWELHTLPPYETLRARAAVAGCASTTT